MRGRRLIELGLAAMIAGGGLFAAFVPGAASDTPRHDLDPALTGHALPTPRINPVHANSPDLFSNLRISETSRRVANALMRRAAAPLGYAPDPREPAPFIEREGISLTSRAEADSEDGWSASAMGIQVRVAPDAGTSEPQWWIVGGAGHESYALSPGSLREYTVAPFSSETVIGDTHLGVAVKLSDNAHASFGYVREKREFHLGREDWEEDEHFIGVGLHARW